MHLNNWYYNVEYDNKPLFRYQRANLAFEEKGDDVTGVTVEDG